MIKFQYFLKSFHGKNKTEKKKFGKKRHLIRIAYAGGIEINNF